MKKIFFWLIFIVFIILTGAVLLIEIEQSKESIFSPPEMIIPQKTITLILVGDIMLDRGMEYMINTQGNGDFKFPFLKIADKFQQADILFGNLEGPISDKGEKVGSIYSFRNDPKSIEGLIYAGFDAISLANNHAFDYGREALEDTFLRLKGAGVDEHSFISTRRSARVIDYVGAGLSENEAYSPVIEEINGSINSPPLRVAFLAYTNLGPETWKAGENNSGIAWVNEEDLEKIKEDIKLAKEKADILIVSLHSGEEYQKEPTKFQIEFSKAAIDAGADIVIGHHPHVVQSNEKYGNGYIFYSLGNFVFDQGFSEETMRGQIVKVLIGDAKIKEVTPVEIGINNYFQPEIIK